MDTKCWLQDFIRFADWKYVSNLCPLADGEVLKNLPKSEVKVIKASLKYPENCYFRVEKQYILQQCIR